MIVSVRLRDLLEYLSRLLEIAAARVELGEGEQEVMTAGRDAQHLFHRRDRRLDVLARHETHKSKQVVRLDEIRPQLNRFLQMLANFYQQFRRESNRLALGAEAAQCE